MLYKQYIELCRNLTMDKNCSYTIVNSIKNNKNNTGVNTE